MTEMTKTTTFKIYVRVGDNGSTAAITDHEMDRGACLDNVWTTDGVSAYHDHVISVTVPVPLPLDQMPAGASVTLDAPAPAVAAAPA